MPIYTHVAQELQYDSMPLHEILALPEGPQTEALQHFYANSDPNNELVLIKTNSGKRMDVMLNGHKFTIMGKGRRVSRRQAVRLLLDYGYQGKYWGRERTTGIRKIDLPRVTEEERERIQWYNPDIDFKSFNPNEDFLIHVPGAQDDEVEDEILEFEAQE